MAKAFQLSVVAPDRVVFEDTVNSTVLPGSDGYLGVMAGHEDMIVALRPGVLEYKDTNDQRHHVSIDGGFAEIGENRVIVLADNARRAIEIDIAENEQILEEVRKALRGEECSMSLEVAQEEMERALARLRAARRN